MLCDVLDGWYHWLEVGSGDLKRKKTYIQHVKKINQKKKPEPVLKEEKPIRGRKIKMQQGLNDRSFVLLLRKLLVALKD